MTNSIWFSTLNDSERRELDSGPNDPVLSTPDILVIGGGLIGLAAAYFASLRGAKVQLIESGRFAGGASGASAGGVFPNVDALRYPAAYQALAHLSRDLWGRLSVRPGFEFDWRVAGVLLVDSTHLQPSATEFVARQLEQGYSAQAVDGGQIALLEPHLKPGIASGAYYPSEAHLHPVKAALSLARAARRLDCRLTTGIHVLSAEIANHRLTAVQTSAGRISASHVIVATGWDASWLADLVPKPLPLHPVSGQLLASDPLPQLLGRPVLGQYLIFQLRSGEIVTGGDEVPGTRAAPDPRITAEIIAAACEFIPALRDVAFPHAWCGLRPATPDGLPIIDRLPVADNLYLASGHFKKGVLLAPATGKLLTDWILDGTRPDELAFFSLARFLSVAR